MKKRIVEMSVNELASAHITDCACGKAHQASLKEILLRPGALSEVPALVQRIGGKKAFVYFDKNTRAVAGDKVISLLEAAGIACSSYCYPQTSLEPNNEAVGQLAMAFDRSCDVVIGVGSGTLNDLGKIVAVLAQRPFIIVATAPSMDGYASATSSMNFDGVKISLNSKMPDAIVADIDLICTAPVRMFQSGFGDMVAKFTSLCDWRIAHLVTGEYYCAEIAALVRKSLNLCMDTAAGILQQDPTTATALTEGLIFSGLAMALAGVSRPASGTEHYFSHLWDMRSAALGRRGDTHGLQCLIGTLETLRILEQTQNLIPEREKALAYVAAFDKDKWARDLRGLLADAAEPLIALEEKEQKYAAAGHAKRLENILSQWPEIKHEIELVLLETAALQQILDLIQAPKNVEETLIEEPRIREVYFASKDIRDKYIITRLLWDIGELDAVADVLYR